MKPLLLLPQVRRHLSAVLLFAAVPNLTAAVHPLPRGTPESQGVSSAALLEFVEAADRQLPGLNSLMILRHGRVIAEGWWTPYRPESPHELYSLSKSFTSTAVGFAVAEGRLSVDDPVLKFFPDDAPENPDANLKAMRVRDLLCMSAGHQDETSSAPDRISAKSFLAHPVPHKPGTHFRYNTPATFMLSAIVQRQTGDTVLDYLRPRLFEPLGIDNPLWNTNSQGISLGGYGLSIRTEDIARFGQFYLQRGEWAGRQLLPASWIDQATSRQVSNGSNPRSDWEQGYGYQFWRCRHGAYRGDGAFGQYCLVLPDQDAVIAITSGVRDMQAVLDLIWERLLPTFGNFAMPADPDNHRRLTDRLNALQLRTPEGAPSSTLAAEVYGRRFVFPTNDQQLVSVRMSSGDASDEVTLHLEFKTGEGLILCGHGKWRESRGPLGPISYQAIAGAGAWTANDTYTARACAYETPYTFTWTLRFSGDQVFLDAEASVAFGPTKGRQLIGQRE